MTPLDPGAAVPPPVGSRRRGSRIALRALANPVQTQQRRHEPANGAQKRESLIRLPGATVGAAEAQAGPVKGAATAAVEPVDEQAKGDEPGDGEDEVGGPVDEAAGKGEEPDDGEEDGETGDDFGVDEAAEVPAGIVGLVEVVACDTGDDGGKDQLGKRKKMLVSAVCSWSEFGDYPMSWTKSWGRSLPPPSGTPWRGDPSRSFWRVNQYQVGDMWYGRRMCSYSLVQCGAKGYSLEYSVCV